MGKKGKSEPPIPTTVIGEGVRLESANLTGSENVVIYGAFVGDIDLDGILSVGESGRVIGNIRAKRIEISGRVKGIVSCDATVYLTPTAYVEGNIETQILKMDEGARINGRCQMADGQTDNISLELSELEGKLRFDFSKMGDTLIPENGPPIISTSA
ncbi:MAG: polymer-forming cytoskeletal protein [Oscillospiraceae bacterium]|nr:polymer-forming cytoskeletal protein [Oscillospiraceae bacterium]